MKTSRLTDKHFKSKNVQRFHQQINSSSDFSGCGFYCVWLAICGFAIYFVIYTYSPPLPAIIVWIDSIIILGATISFFLFEKFLPTISYIFYKPPFPSWDTGNIILINPDGNPEMCKVYQYPAIQGLFGYRLPNAGDIEKIEKFMKSA